MTVDIHALIKTSVTSTNVQKFYRPQDTTAMDALGSVTISQKGDEGTVDIRVASLDSTAPLAGYHFESPTQGSM